MIRLLTAFAIVAAAAVGAETFGMRLRPAPRDLASIHAPVIIREAPTNETCLVARRDGSLELFAITKPASDSVSTLRSRDGGLTWSEPEVAFPLPGKAYYAVQVLEATDGALHAVVHILGEGPGGYRNRLYEVYHTSRAPAAAAWSAPKKIVPGYIGSIRGFIQLKSGRLVLAVARAIPERMTARKSGPDFGWNSTFVYFSDDAGATWRESSDQLTLALNGPNATRYGAIEPVLLELRDGRVWMLVRDRGGRLWQSFSRDGGAGWSALERSPFISSDSPAALLRLRDGKILLLTNACQNWTNPRSYAMGGREVLHAAISADEGESWRGFREILHEPVAETRGDRGTAYASAVENSAGKIVVVSGQGEGKRAIVAFDPRWLEERDARDDQSYGPAQWTAYGAPAPRREDSSSIALPIMAGQPGGAAWNFPLGESGLIEARLEVPTGVTNLKLCLNDHFTRLDDRHAASNAVFVVPLEKPGAHSVSLRWDRAAVVARVGGVERRLAAQRPAQLGVHTLRIEFTGGPDGAHVVVSDLSAQLSR